MIDVIGAQNHVNFMGFIFIQKMRSNLFWRSIFFICFIYGLKVLSRSACVWEFPTTKIL